MTSDWLSTAPPNMVAGDATLRMRVIHEGRTGVATTNRLDGEGLREVVARATAICRRARPNPDQPPLAEPATSTASPSLGYVSATVHADPEMRAAGVRAVIAAGDASDLEVSGAFSTEAATLAVANSRGMSNSHSVTHSTSAPSIQAETRAAQAVPCASPSTTSTNGAGPLAS